jgi:hypothetical protein
MAGMSADGGRFRWRHVLVCGLLWGLTVMLADSMSQPMGDLSLAEWLAFSLGLLLQHSVTGLIWAGGLKLTEDARRTRLLAPLVFLAAWAVALAIHELTVRRVLGGGSSLSAVVHNLPIADIGAHLAWVNLFYGGLYATGFLSIRRTQRLRRRLAELRLGRHQAETQLREVRLQAVRGQIQPAMLLEALDALRRAYARDTAQGDAMFDLIIAFLRAAMPGLRSGASTLSAELGVVSRYAALREALDAGPPYWRLQMAEPPADLPFPPLRLLPALDRMSRATPPGAVVQLTALAGPDGFVLRIGARARPPLPAELMGALRSGLRQDLGLGSMLVDTVDDLVVAELRVRTPSRPLAA